MAAQQIEVRSTPIVGHPDDSIRSAAVDAHFNALQSMRKMLADRDVRIIATAQMDNVTTGFQ